MTKQSLVPILLPADPTQPLEAATKAYVDANAGGGGSVDTLWVGPEAPTDPDIELWYDTDEQFALDDSLSLPTAGKSGHAAAADATGPTVGTTAYVVKTVALPAMGVAGRIHVWGPMRIQKTVNTDRFLVSFEYNGVIIGQDATGSSTDGMAMEPHYASGSVAVDGKVAGTLTSSLTRIAGTGTATIVGDANNYFLHWMFVPTGGGERVDYSGLDVRYSPLRYTAITTIPGTTYTMALTDEGQFLVFSSATAVTLTVPTDATVPFAVGTKLDGCQSGAGRITVGGAGVTIQGTPTLVTRAAGSAFSLIKTATDNWLLTGDLG